MKFSHNTTMLFAAFNTPYNITLAITTALIAYAGVIAQYAKKYIFGDIEFLSFLLVAIAADTLIGAYANRNKFNFNIFIGSLFDKIIKYCLLLISVHVATHFTVDGNKIEYFTWLDYAVYSAMIAKEFLSVVKHGGTTLSNLLPDWLIDKIKSIPIKKDDVQS